jgi:hypothetical protein
MTENQFEEAAGAPTTEDAADGDAVAELAAEAEEPDDARVSTGVLVVDDVLGTLEGLGDMPVEEHLPIFEAAHEELRGALDGAEPEGEPEPEPEPEPESD